MKSADAFNMDINILKEDDFDGILWDGNDDEDDRVLSSEINNGPQDEVSNNKPEIQKHGFIRINTLSNQNDQHSRLMNIDCTVPSLPLPPSALDLSTSRAFPTVDLEDTFLNSFVSTLAESSSSQDAPNNVLNASTGLPLFPSTSSNNYGTNITLNDSRNIDGVHSTQTVGASTAALTNNDCENMLLPPNNLSFWGQTQSTTQNHFCEGNKNLPSNLPHQFQQSNKTSMHPQTIGKKWNLIQGQNVVPINQTNLGNLDSNTVKSSTSHSNNNNEIRPSSSQLKSHNVSDNETMSHSVRDKKRKSKEPGSQKHKHKLNKDDKAQVPPFFLFDAPVELRHNFMKAQQSHDIPTSIQDSNSFHYGLAVNSFQPMIKYKDNRIKSLTMLNSVDDIVNPRGKKVELLDARQKKNKRGNERNEREQQRAQKITELIDKLRLTMVQNGWKVEMKSKYQILSTCGEYLNHLKAITKEKEEKLEKTKADLALRAQKLKEDQGSQGSRSDPESVTSSLTAFSTSSSHAISNSSDDARKGDKNKHNPSQFAQSESSSDKPNPSQSGFSSHKPNPSQYESSSDKLSPSQSKSSSDKPSPLQSESSCDKPNPSQSESSSDQIPKKQCVDDGSGTSSDSGHKGVHIAMNKMSSSISDITDSNKGSSDGKTSVETELKPTLVTSSEGCSQRSGEVEVSSTAAVVSGIGSQRHGHTHADVVIKAGLGKRRKRHHEPTSLDDDFVLDYKEVFMTSNVPQIISTLAGRIIISNDCFHRITGLSHQQMKRITLFSLIQTEKLPELYKLVAKSLAEIKDVIVENEEGDSSISSTPFFKSMTLPCIKFQPRKNYQFDLFMNVCYVWNENCFHCAFYDKIGRDREGGYISTEMLGILDL